MSYVKTKGRGGMPLGDFAALTQSSCGPDQKYDPEYTFNGIKGQCVTQAQYDAYHAANPSASSSSGSSWWQKLLSSATDVAKAALTPGQVTNIQAQPSGMSDTTKIALVGGGVVALALILKSRRK